MIYGIGTDIVAVARIRSAMERHGERFAEHVLCEPEMDELKRAPDAARFIAKRFAAKEAFAKAYGTGVRAPVTLHAIAVAHDELGKPFYTFNSELVGLMEESGLVCHLSISDEREHVVAMAVIEQI